MLFPVAQGKEEAPESDTEESESVINNAGAAASAKDINGSSSSSEDDTSDEDTEDKDDSDKSEVLNTHLIVLTYCYLSSLKS